MNPRDEANVNDVKIGERLRCLRKHRKITIKKMSMDLGMSYSFLSALENDKCSISIVNLMKILEYFDVDLAYFFASSDSKSNVQLFRKQSVTKYLTQDGLVFQNITSGHADNIDVSLISHPPNSPSIPRVYGHKKGGEEFIYVLEGNLVVLVDGKTHELEVGDSVLFDSELDHSIYTEKTAAVFLLISSPPYCVNHV